MTSSRFPPGNIKGLKIIPRQRYLSFSKSGRAGLAKSIAPNSRRKALQCGADPCENCPGLSNVHPCEDGFCRFAQFHVLIPRPRGLISRGELFNCPLADPL
jgi:hypothetical protein